MVNLLFALLKVVFQAKLQTYSCKPEEVGGYILLCADSFMGRQALILINVQKEKLQP